MPKERTNLALDVDIRDAADAERKELSPAESRSRFYDVSAKARIAKLKRARRRAEGK